MTPYGTTPDQLLQVAEAAVELLRQMRHDTVLSIDMLKGPRTLENALILNKHHPDRQPQGYVPLKLGQLPVLREQLDRLVETGDLVSSGLLEWKLGFKNLGPGWVSCPACRFHWKMDAKA